MKTSKRVFPFGLIQLALLLVFSLPAFAASPLDSRFEIIGVISDVGLRKNAYSVVVLKDTSSGKSIFRRRDEILLAPYRIAEIHRNYLILSEGSKKIRLDRQQFGPLASSSVGKASPGLSDVPQNTYAGSALGSGNEDYTDYDSADHYDPIESVTNDAGSRYPARGPVGPPGSGMGDPIAPIPPPPPPPLPPSDLAPGFDDFPEPAPEANQYNDYDFEMDDYFDE